MVDGSPDGLAKAALGLYSSLAFKLPPNQFTTLAAFILTRPGELKVISLATGSKCLPTERFSKTGDALHDSHAEVLARRGAIRWLMEELRRGGASQQGSAWLARVPSGKCSLRDGVHLHLYVSTVPCKYSQCRDVTTIYLDITCRR